MENSNWVFERSSGFAGWRCTKCATWIYDRSPFVCNCKPIHLEGITWSDHYHSGECPDCGEKIPSVAEEGDECGNCGHVFWLTFENAGN